LTGCIFHGLSFVFETIYSSGLRDGHSSVMSGLDNTMTMLKKMTEEYDECKERDEESAKLKEKTIVL